MSINYFDIIIGIIILLLGLKGLINGFFKEAFGLIGIIGGIFIASRLGRPIGLMISNHITSFTNQTAITFTGFLLTFAIFWLFMIAVGYAFKKLSRISGLGAIDNILGFVVGAGKFFLIFAVIIYAIYNIKVFRANIKPIMKNSILFPILVKTGGFIMKISPATVSQDINKTIPIKQLKITIQKHILNDFNNSKQNTEVNKSS